MRLWRRFGRRISGDEIRGDVRSTTVQGPLSIGKDIRVTQEARDLTVSDAELAELRGALAGLRQEIEAGVPDDRRAAALERVDELEEALTSPEPDPTTAALVVRWFRKHLPAIAGTVTGVVVNPIVGKLVASAGDAAVAEFEELLGSER